MDPCTPRSDHLVRSRRTRLCRRIGFSSDTAECWLCQHRSPGRRVSSESEDGIRLASVTEPTATNPYVRAPADAVANDPCRLVGNTSPLATDSAVCDSPARNRKRAAVTPPSRERSSCRAPEGPSPGLFVRVQNVLAVCQEERHERRACNKCRPQDVTNPPAGADANTAPFNPKKHEERCYQREDVDGEELRGIVPGERVVPEIQRATYRPIAAYRCRSFMNRPWHMRQAMRANSEKGR